MNSDASGNWPPSYHFAFTAGLSLRAGNSKSMIKSGPMARTMIVFHSLGLAMALVFAWSGRCTLQHEVAISLVGHEHAMLGLATASSCTSDPGVA